MSFYSKLVFISAINLALPDQLDQKLSESKLAIWLLLYVKNKLKQISQNSGESEEGTI